MVLNLIANSINDRISVYNNQQICLENDNYIIDENLDGTADYSFENPNFSFVQLQTNLVARWAYIPGSEIFLVWARGSVGDANIQEDLVESVSEQVFNEPANDTFLVKFTYRFTR